MRAHVAEAYTAFMHAWALHFLAGEVLRLPHALLDAGQKCLTEFRLSRPHIQARMRDRWPRTIIGSSSPIGKAVYGGQYCIARLQMLASLYHCRLGSGLPRHRRYWGIVLAIGYR